MEITKNLLSDKIYGSINEVKIPSICRKFPPCAPSTLSQNETTLPSLEGCVGTNPTNFTWRLIPWLEASGEVQMAIDSWLLEQHRLGKHPPTLRFYTWHPAAISLGYHQQDYPEHWHNLTWQGKGIDIVRRATGGRAVLHQGDLTYSVVTSLNSGNRLAAYIYICQFLITGWRSLGVELDYGVTTEYRSNDNCFASATGADLVTAEGIKAIGSAQLRKRRAILQHGSMILNPNEELFYKVFKQPSPSHLLDLIPRKSDLSPSETRSGFGFAEVGSDRQIVTIIEALTQAAMDCFKINLIPQPLSNREWQDILSSHSFLRY